MRIHGTIRFSGAAPAPDIAASTRIPVAARRSCWIVKRDPPEENAAMYRASPTVAASLWPLWGWLNGTCVVLFERESHK